MPAVNPPSSLPPLLAALPLGAFGFWKQKVKLINKKQFFTDLVTPHNHKPPVSNFVHLSYSILNRTMETNKMTKKRASHLRPTTNLMGRVPLFSSVPVFFNLIRLQFSFFIWCHSFCFLFVLTLQQFIHLSVSVVFKLSSVFSGKFCGLAFHILFYLMNLRIAIYIMI